MHINILNQKAAKTDLCRFILFTLKLGIYSLASSMEFTSFFKVGFESFDLTHHLPGSENLL